jgi:hypothetical protein
MMLCSWCWYDNFWLSSAWKPRYYYGSCRGYPCSQEYALEPGRSHTLPSGVRMASRVSLGDSNRSLHQKITSLSHTCRYGVIENKT